jgi:hypothetical protein
VTSPHRKRKRSDVRPRGGTIERWQQPELLGWEVPKRDPHERRPRAPDYWEPEAAAEIAEVTTASDDAVGGDISKEATDRGAATGGAAAMAEASAAHPRELRLSNHFTRERKPRREKQRTL